MRVFSDLILGVEYLSDAKKISPVKDAEGKVVEGLMSVDSTIKSDPDMDSDDATAEKRLDHFWAFPDLSYDEVTYKKFKKWRDEYFKKYIKGLQKVKKSSFKDDDEKKAFQGRMGGIMAWVKAEFDNLSFYQAVSPIGEFEGKEYFGSLVYCWYAPGATDPKLVFMTDAYSEEKF